MDAAGVGRPRRIGYTRIMTENQTPITEADILTEVVEPDKPGLAPALARAILQVGFKPEAIERLNSLAAKSREGTLTAAEQSTLEKYLRVGGFLNLLQAKARVCLAADSSTSA